MAIDDNDIELGYSGNKNYDGATVWAVRIYHPKKGLCRA